MIHPLRQLRTLDLRVPTRAGGPNHLSAASGLVQVDRLLYVIGDDENQLAVFPFPGVSAGQLIRLFAGELPAQKKPRKAEKADLEALVRLPPFGTAPAGALLALGSGSRTNRCRGAQLDLATAAVTQIDLSPLYLALCEEFGELNIEGAVVRGGELILAQRGNRSHRRNALVHLHLESILSAIQDQQPWSAASISGISDFQLDTSPDPAAVPLSFTDLCALPDGSLLFTAVAEDTSDNYADGACSDAAIGLIGPGNQLCFVYRLGAAYKLEGISAEVDGDRVRLLLVSDADDPEIAACLLSGEMVGYPFV